MASGKLTDSIANGTHSARPATPNVGSNGISIYYETDTGNTFVYSTTAGWVNSTARRHWEPRRASRFLSTRQPPERTGTLRVIRRRVISRERRLSRHQRDPIRSACGLSFSKTHPPRIRTTALPYRRTERTSSLPTSRLWRAVFARAYYGTISAAPAGAYFSPFQLGANQLGFIELDVLLDVGDRQRRSANQQESDLLRAAPHLTGEPSEATRDRRSYDGIFLLRSRCSRFKCDRLRV